MITLVHYLNSSCTRLFDILLWPVRTLDPAWGMLLVSLLAGVLMLWIFGLTSNQKAIARIKDRIAGNLIGVQLFQHDLGVLMRLQGRILLDTLVYMKHSLVPLLVMLLPVLLILAQLNLRYGVRPLEVGEKALVKIKVRDAAMIQRGLRLESGEGIVVETPGVRIPSEREVCWRIRAEKPGAYLLDVRTGAADSQTSNTASSAPGAGPAASGSSVVRKTVEVGRGGRPVAYRRTGTDSLDLLLYPGEPPIPAETGVESVEIIYPEARLEFFGLRVHWLVAFCILSIVFGFAFKPLLRVQI
jgi:uncharacterized membrane protein (DUF106 family)